MRAWIITLIVPGLVLLGACTPENEAAPPEETSSLTDGPSPAPAPEPSPTTEPAVEVEVMPEAEIEPEPEPDTETETETGAVPETEEIPMAPAKGYRAPDFQIKRADGSSFSLSDFGKPVMMNFWTTRCPHCVTEMPLFEEIYEAKKAEGLVLITVNIAESRETVDDFMQDEKIKLPVLLDTTAAIAASYKVRYLPTTFFIDSESIIREAKIGAFRSLNDIEDHMEKIMPTAP